jgi:ABC-type nitrate/sulfonate/bicarbonate transport system permease component
VAVIWFGIGEGVEDLPIIYTVFIVIINTAAGVSVGAQQIRAAGVWAPAARGCSGMSPCRRLCHIFSPVCASPWAARSSTIIAAELVAVMPGSAR